MDYRTQSWSKAYRERAEQLRHMAETEVNPRARDELIDLVRRYEAIANSFAEAEDKAMRHAAD